MKVIVVFAACTALSCFSHRLLAQSSSTATHKPAHKQLFIDVHQLGPGNVTAAAVAQAHAKDLAVQSKYGVRFIRYWVDESRGTVYCLSEAPDSAAIIQTHKEAHGLLPAYVEKVKQGQ